MHKHCRQIPPPPATRDPPWKWWGAEDPSRAQPRSARGLQFRPPPQGAAPPAAATPAVRAAPLGGAGGGGPAGVLADWLRRGRCHVGGSGASPTVEIDRGCSRRVRGRRLPLLVLARIWALRGGGRRDGEKPDEPAHGAGHALLRQGRVHEGAGRFSPEPGRGVPPSSAHRPGPPLGLRPAPRSRGPRCPWQ